MKIKTFQIESEFVPSPVEYDVLFPKEYENSNKAYPLMLFLHGGGNQDRNFLKLIGPIIWDLWEEKIVPEMVVVTPNCDRSLYMDYRDGSEKWESFIIQEFLPYLQKEYRVTLDVNNTFTTVLNPIIVQVSKIWCWHQILRIQPGRQKPSQTFFLFLRQ